MANRKQIKKITAWSYSRVNTHDTCPAKLYYSAIAGLKEPVTLALSYGIDAHNAAEALCRKIAEGKKPTVALRKKFLNYAERDCLTWLTDHLSGADEIIVEMMLAFTDKWEPIPLNNYGQPVFGCGFKWDDIWCRIKSDVIVRREKECHIIDHKTGKVNEDQHEKQLDLYALGCFAYYPEVDTVNATMLYFDHGVTLDRVYTRGKDFTRLKKLWEKKVRKLLSDTRFLPTPNRLCRWCHYSGDNDGPCKAG